MTGFVKLYGTILTSSIWLEDHATLRVWIAMLALADRNGVVGASVGGLAHTSRVTKEECQKALDTFMAPDEDSRTPDNDGRRVEKVQGGWRILNHQMYRDLRTEDQVKEAERKARWRAARSGDGTGRDSPESPDAVLGHTGEFRAEAEADAEADTSIPPAVEVFLKALPEGQNARNWNFIIDGWAKGLGLEGGKAATPEDIATGLTEYLATANRDFAVIHVRSFVERARRNRLKSTARGNPVDHTAEAKRIWQLIKSQGIHHRTTQQEIDTEVAALVTAGSVKDGPAFKSILKKLDFEVLKKAQQESFAVKHIESRLAA